VMGSTDAIDYDGSQVADGDAQLDQYAVDNGIEIDNTLEVDYSFDFDAAGQMATDQLYIEGGQGSGSDWTAGWSFVDERGMFADSFEGAAPQCDCPPLSQRPLVTVTDAGQGTGTTTWTCDNTYLLNGYVFVNSGQVLTVEPGTVIRGAAGSGADASALIVAAGGQIDAEGNANCPIIMTYEADPLDGSVSYDTRGQWGGFIMLGNASTNFGGVAQVEGIPPTTIAPPTVAATTEKAAVPSATCPSATVERSSEPLTKSTASPSVVSVAAPRWTTSRSSPTWTTASSSSVEP
jgi:hypothetical protein